MNKQNEKKSEQLGMPIGTATAILRKNILFTMIKQLNLDVCFQCQKEIETVDNLSIEHKVPWLDSENPKELFFSLDNIAFSHLSCNVKASRKKVGLNSIHGTKTQYIYGCRCDLCKQAQRDFFRKYRNTKKENYRSFV